MNSTLDSGTVFPICRLPCQLRRPQPQAGDCHCHMVKGTPNLLGQRVCVQDKKTTICVLLRGETLQAWRWRCSEPDRFSLSFDNAAHVQQRKVCLLCSKNDSVWISSSMRKLKIPRNLGKLVQGGQRALVQGSRHRLLALLHRCPSSIASGFRAPGPLARAEGFSHRGQGRTSVCPCRVWRCGGASWVQICKGRSLAYTAADCWGSTAVAAIHPLPTAYNSPSPPLIFFRSLTCSTIFYPSPLSSSNRAC